MSSGEPAPAVPTLTGLVRQQDPRIPHLVLLKAGSASSPIFMTYGMGAHATGQRIQDRGWKNYRPRFYDGKRSL
jgi:hypothetical protein